MGPPCSRVWAAVVSMFWYFVFLVAALTGLALLGLSVYGAVKGAAGTRPCYGFLHEVNHLAGAFAALLGAWANDYLWSDAECRRGLVRWADRGAVIPTEASVFFVMIFCLPGYIWSMGRLIAGMPLGLARGAGPRNRLIPSWCLLFGRARFA